MPIHSDYSDEQFIAHVIDIAAQQRAEDPAKEQTNDRGNVWVRAYADLCIAYSRDSGVYYFGYNGEAGGITRLDKQKKQHETLDTEMAYRRLHRLSEYIASPAISSGDNPLRRPLANCAEANAVSIALAYDERVDRLFLMAFYPDDGPYKKHHNYLPHLKPPCSNCQTWIGMTYGYWINGIHLND
ncbi:hypothetical protein FHW68_000211 [Pseudomonas sp. Tn43]|uniref:hypothetical protein n=1 Tax=unclassified Pseudomonas TaxID=196821 RepID=UPI000BAB25C1|nr:MULTISPECIES: hypothetical protein [unclassified Pseudomonas]MBB3238739.1 hypothetical protein [Pseudomonas sp. Tn43]PAU51351.1 hypothetical protein BZL43_26260 [Pseudomonas sp. PICF141]